MNNITSKLVKSVQQAKENKSDHKTDPKTKPRTKHHEETRQSEATRKLNPNNSKSLTAKSKSVNNNHTGFSSNRVWPD